MTFVPVMWSIWGALVVLMACMLVYRGNLEKDEDDNGHQPHGDQESLDHIDDRFADERPAAAGLTGVPLLYVDVAQALSWYTISTT